MNNFTQILNNWENFNFVSFLETRNTNNVLEILQKDNLTEYDFLTLLSPAADNVLEQIAQRSHDITIKEFGKTIQIFTPLYLSNYCTNKCIYCGFNVLNKITRSKLTVQQAIDESIKINNLGIRHILLLTGGDRKNSSVDYIKTIIRKIKPYFDSISIEMYAMTETEYKELVSLGVDNVTMYQETYSPKRYSEVHLAGEKSDYSFRLNAPERAAKSGVNSINFGALLGLDNPIKDFFKAAIHSEYIRNKYPGCDVGISLPRIKSAIGGFKVSEPVNDLLFTKMLMAYRLFIHRGLISISTRESATFRNNILPLGVNKMSAESKTTVGGHSEDHSDPQFEISDHRTVKELDEYLISKEMQPVYKDWVIV